ncbi:TetR/AcrR family transcriptional regulator [Nocardioides daphniae]|uniref:TetR/AcrR family transcriptional regulator n=1 Tax=Nocardioides daphniae TaxID=402297 RepID=A0A4P7UE01_9ACTN|nr:TetR/AcrR family transcriptional regulator [Nocardioides daphniae]
MVAAALDLADSEGISALTIRALASGLGVKPMAIYHHVANKDEILDAIVDAVYAETYLPRPYAPWREELARRTRSVHDALNRHPWALGLMETRKAPGPANLASHEAVLEVLLTAGFSLGATAHAYATLDAFVYGFCLQEVMLDSIDLAGSADDLLAGMNLTGHPRMAQFAAEHVLQPGYAFGDSFEVGLGLVLDGLEQLRRSA